MLSNCKHVQNTVFYRIIVILYVYKYNNHNLYIILFIILLNAQSAFPNMLHCGKWISKTDILGWALVGFLRWIDRFDGL